MLIDRYPPEDVFARVPELAPRAAVEYAKEQGATIVEGYPFEPEGAKVPDVFGATGLTSTFRQVGFVEVFRHSPTRPIMRGRA